METRVYHFETGEPALTDLASNVLPVETFINPLTLDAASFLGHMNLSNFDTEGPLPTGKYYVEVDPNSIGAGYTFQNDSSCH